MELLVIGLCLSRNLGGPAMALSLRDGLRKRLPDTKLRFAVIPGRPEEKEWADRYGLDIAYRTSKWLDYAYYLPDSLLRLRGKLSPGSKITDETMANRRSLVREFHKAVASADMLLNMSGVAYVGDGVRSRWAGFSDHYCCSLARRFRKPYAAFIQSYGPFDDPWVARYARKEFSQVPFVPARGRKCAELCREIAPKGVAVEDYPDTAILLPSASDSWTRAYLQEKKLTPQGYVVISPSAIIRRTKRIRTGCMGDNHITYCRLLIKHFTDTGHQVLLLPHMYSSVPHECDRDVCNEIMESNDICNAEEEHVAIVDDDIDPMQAKALVSNAKFAVVSRYHALVAAVSTMTPVATLGWNLKYQDLLDYYSLGNCAIDARLMSPGMAVRETLSIWQWWQSASEERLLQWHDDQALCEARVNLGFDRLSDWIQLNAK